MTRVFVGSEALAAGRVTKYDLRARYQHVLPDVYATDGQPLTLFDRTVAAWLAVSCQALRRQPCTVPGG